ncbi:Transmembrane protein 132D [Dissostichus eleginoides]|uniref:Transmembrane protein 132D n=1 Tax=Dissostichus eleginoides TaxID=100907 RepID=A0AAD9BJQ9_DISEL|nr:Transmembrane protein 132D [Dissostichus eleginoides]
MAKYQVSLAGGVQELHDEMSHCLFPESHHPRLLHFDLPAPHTFLSIPVAPQLTPSLILCSVLPAVIPLSTLVAESQKAAVDIDASSTPSPVYPSVNFKVLNVDHVFLRRNSPTPSRNSSQKAQTFLITGKGAGLLQPAVNASFGPITVDAPVPPDLLLSGRTILPFILVRQVRSSSPVVKILFHMPTGSDITVGQERMGSGEDNLSKSARAKAKDGGHCVTAYAFWETKEVRGACLVSPGSRSGSSSREAGKTEGVKGLQGNLVDVYFQSRRDPKASVPRRIACNGEPHLFPTEARRRRGGPDFFQAPEGHGRCNFLRVLPSTSSLETFTLRATVKSGLSFSAARPSESALWDIIVEPSRGATPNTVSVVCQRKVTVTAKRGLLEVLQLDFVPKDVSEQAESQTISWRLEMPGNLKDVGIMRIYTTQRDYVGLAPLVMKTDILNTAKLMGVTVSVPVKTLAVEADGSVTDVTNYTRCRSTEEDVLKVSERCDYVYVNGNETRGKSRVVLDFTYGFLSAQLELSVWIPRLPLLIDVADPELSQIKGWRVPVTSGNRRSTWDSEEEEDVRKGRGCMLQYQHSRLTVLTPFIAQADAEAPSDPLTGAEPVEYFMGPDWQVDVTNIVRSFLKVSDPEVARVQDGVVLQGRAVGTTTVQVLSPLTWSVLAERSISVVDDKVSVTELGVQLVSGLSLSLRLSPGSNGAIVATATTREMITQLEQIVLFSLVPPKHWKIEQSVVIIIVLSFFLSQEAVVSCWVQFSDGAVTPLELFDRSIYSLTVSTPDEKVATVRRTQQSTFIVTQGEGKSQGALVRVELRICEECQKSKRKGKLAVGTGLLRINLQSSRRVSGGEGGGGGNDRLTDLDGGALELVGDPKTTKRVVADVDNWLYRSTPPAQKETTTAEPTTSTTVSTRAMVRPVFRVRTTTRATRGTTTTAIPTTTATTTTSAMSFNTLLSTTIPLYTTVGLVSKGEEQKRSFGNMIDNPNSTPNKNIPKAEVTPKKQTPKVIESDLIRTFRALSQIEIGMYALVGLACVAILAFLVNCLSYNLCFRNKKTAMKAAPAPIGDPNDHKHDWVWLGNDGHPPPGIPDQVSTLKREAHRSLESRHSVDSIGPHGLEVALPTVSGPPVPERTATLGRSRNTSQQQHFQGIAIDPMANRSATLLARPHRSEPLHSPTSKRNQVQFTTFTTLDVKHLAALKKNGVDLNWANQQALQLQQAHAEPQSPLPDMPWPVVKPIGEPQ